MGWHIFKPSGSDSNVGRVHQPEGDPWAEDDEGERGVDLEQEETGLTLKQELQRRDGLVPEWKSEKFVFK